MSTLVSIIIPCYNQAQYLSEALESVLNQNYLNWECIIVNDESPDNTDEIAKEWLIKDQRFKYIEKINGGLSSARNAGISNAKGEFILPLDADDKIGSQYLQLAINEFEKDNQLKIVYCKAEKFGEEKGLWDLSDFSIFNLVKRNMIFCTAFFRKAEWEKVGGYDVNLIYGLEDWEFWIAILKNGGKVKRLEEVCFFYRVKRVSMAVAITPEEVDFSNDYIRKKHIDFILSNYDTLNLYRQESLRQLRSEKFVINLFFKMFFGTRLFKKN